MEKYTLLNAKVLASINELADTVNGTVVADSSYGTRPGDRFAMITEPHILYKVAFPNGYGCSIVKGGFISYGREDDLWELAVLRRGELCYRTPITNDVLGWLTDDEVLDTCRKIAALEDREY